MRNPKARPTITCGKGRTVQTEKQQCDINLIVKDFTRTGFVHFVNREPPQFGEAPSIDYHEAMNAIRTAEEDFGLLPAQIRKEFNNDPAQFLDFMGNQDNLERARELGLAEPAYTQEKISPQEAPTEPTTPTE